MRNQNGSVFPRTFYWSINISGNIETGETFNSDIFQDISVKFTGVGDFWVKISADLRHPIKLHPLDDSFFNKISPFFPGLAIMPFTCEFFHLKISLILCPIMADAEIVFLGMTV